MRIASLIGVTLIGILQFYTVTGRSLQQINNNQTNKYVWPHEGQYTYHNFFGGTCTKPSSLNLWDWIMLRHENGANKRLCDKWSTYFPSYERYLSKYRGCDVNILELGVQSGGSQEMWLEYFGDSSHAYGADVDNRILTFNSQRIHNFVGDIGNASFLMDLCQKIPRIDVVLDDASHIPWHQILAFEVLFPCLNEHGGIYIVEDLNANYLKIPPYSNQGTEASSFIEYIKSRIDEMNAYWSCPYGFVLTPAGREYRRKVPDKIWPALPASEYKCQTPDGLINTPVKVTSATQNVLGIHIHDGLIVVEKMPKRGRSLNVQAGVLNNKKHHVGYTSYSRDEAFKHLKELKETKGLETFSSPR